MNAPLTAFTVLSLLSTHLSLLSTHLPLLYELGLSLGLLLEARLQREVALDLEAAHQTRFHVSLLLRQLVLVARLVSLDAVR